MNGNLDHEWAKISAWLQAKGLQLHIPLRGPAILVKKPAMVKVAADNCHDPLPLPQGH